MLFTSTFEYAYMSIMEAAAKNYTFDSHGDVGGGLGAGGGATTTKSVSFSAKQASLFPILPSVTWNFKF